MRWRQGRRSSNVEDRRGRRPRMVLGSGIGLGGILVVALLGLLMDGNPLALLQMLLSTDGMVGAETGEITGSQEDVDFVSVVLADTEDVWHELFRRTGKTYREPTLVLFSGAVESACGFQGAAAGPFYCPADSQVYLDLAFFDELDRQLGAPGDFAQAYVIAHEIGHHVQNLLGITDEVSRREDAAGEAEASELSVRLELQADFLAGVWAHHAERARQVLEEGDLEEALNAASAVGDDRLQKAARGTVTPDSFTHGTSEQRMRWFRKGFETGDLAQGDTFSVRDP